MSLTLVGSASLAVPVLVAARFANVGVAFTAKPGATSLTLATADGDITSSGSAILRYVARLTSNTLLGAAGTEAGAVDAWTDTVYASLLSPALVAVVQKHGQVLQSLKNMGIQSSPFQTTARSACASLGAIMDRLEGHFLSKTFLVGRSITIADIALAAGVGPCLALLLTHEEVAKLPNLQRWYNTIANQANFLAVTEPAKLVTPRGRSAIDLPPQPAHVAALADKSVALNAGLKKAKTQRDKEKEARAKAAKAASASSASSGSGSGSGAGVTVNAANVAKVTATDSQPASNLTDKDLPADEKISKALNKLAELGINQTTVTHAPAFTIDELAAVSGSVQGKLCKNLFLKAKKGKSADDSRLWLVVALHDTATNMKVIGQKLGYGKIALRFGDDKTLESNLGVVKGSVSPFCLMNDTALQVNVVLDAAMLQEEHLAFHPLTNTASTTVSPADLVKFIQATGHNPVVMDFA